LHSKQLPEPFIDEYEPAAQLAHEAEFEVENLPATQIEHVEDD
jgi:hypothetical protein